jgi:hypothetical protein
MGKREKEKFAPRRRTWLLKDVERRKEFDVKVADSWEERGGDDGV